MPQKMARIQLIIGLDVGQKLFGNLHLFTCSLKLCSSGKAVSALCYEVAGDQAEQKHKGFSLIYSAGLLSTM